MAVSPTDPPGCGSQFFVTLADGIDYLDGKHAVFGHVVEGFETLDRINEAFLDKEGRPLQDIRIRHVEVLGEFIEKSECSLRKRAVTRSFLSDPYTLPRTVVFTGKSHRLLIVLREHSCRQTSSSSLLYPS